MSEFVGTPIPEDRRARHPRARCGIEVGMISISPGTEPICRVTEKPNPLQS